MAIWRMPSLNGRGSNLRVTLPAFGRVPSQETKTRGSLSWLMGIVLLRSLVEFGEMPAYAQTSRLDDGTPAAYTAAPSRPSSPLAADNEMMVDTAGSRVGGRGAGQNTEAGQPPIELAARRIADQMVPALGNPLWRLPLKQFSATRERPIFSPSRRPPAPPPTFAAPIEVKQPPKPREPERPTIALAGTIIGTNGYRVAFFRDTSTQDVLRLRMGENYHGWVVRLINRREARLVKDGEQALLELPKPAGTSAPVRTGKDILLEQVWTIGAD